MKIHNSYHLEYSNYCLHVEWYILKVSADAPFNLLKVFLDYAGPRNEPIFLCTGVYYYNYEKGEDAVDHKKK